MLELEADLAVENMRSDKQLLKEYLVLAKSKHPEDLKLADEIFAQFVHRHSSMVFNTCLRVLNSQFLAEDASQAVFLVAADKCKALYSGRGQVSSFLYGVALNVSRNMRSSETARYHREQKTAREEAVQHNENIPQRSQWDEILPFIDDALSELPQRQQQAVVLHFLEGKTQKESAAVMGVSRSSIDTYLNRALEKMRVSLARRGAAVSAASLLTIFTTQMAPAATAVQIGAISATAIQASSVVAGASSASSVCLPAVAVAKQATLFYAWTHFKVAVLTACIITATTISGIVFLQPSAEDALVIVEPVVVETVEVPATSDAKDQLTSTASIHRDRWSKVLLVPHDWNAWNVFKDVQRMRGLRVLSLGKKKPLWIAPENRSDTTSVYAFIESMAAQNNMQVQWLRDANCVVLSEPVADELIRELKNDLSSHDAVVRKEAIWRAGWYPNTQVLSLLTSDAFVAMSSASDERKLTRLSLRRLGWPAVLRISDGAWSFVERELASPYGKIMISDLGLAGGVRALNKLESLLNLEEKETWYHESGIRAIAAIGGPSACDICERVFNDEYPHLNIDGSTQLQLACVASLRAIGDSSAMRILKEICDNPQWSVTRESATRAILYIWTYNKDVSIEGLGHTYFPRTDVDLRLNTSRRYFAAKGALLTQEMDRTQIWNYLENEKRFGEHTRNLYVEFLGVIGGLRAVALLEKMKDDPSSRTRAAVIRSLGRIGGSRAYVNIKESLNDNNVHIRLLAIRALIHGGDIRMYDEFRGLITSKNVTFRELDILDQSLTVIPLSHNSIFFEFLESHYEILKRHPTLWRMALQRKQNGQVQWLSAVLGNGNALQKSPEDKKRKELIRFISEIGGVDAYEILEDMRLKAEPGSASYVSILSALAAVGSPRALIEYREMHGIEFNRTVLYER